MIQITAITLVNGEARRMRLKNKTIETTKELENYRARIKDVMQRRLKHPVNIDFTYKQIS